MSEHPSEKTGLPIPVEPIEVWAADELDAQLVRRPTDRARAEGLALTGAGSLLQQQTKLVLEAALEGEIDDHPGYAKHAAEGRDGGNSRNGRRARAVVTEVGPVSVAAPRDRDGTFAPAIVPKHARRLSGIDVRIPDERRAPGLDQSGQRLLPRLHACSPAFPRALKTNDQRVVLGGVFNVLARGCWNAVS
ncbi:transposase [Uniformispora flossi]|uniref:transposase n=1 Tax=Uniformispora flossi TaxID=3390723 RepID=UPI003C30C44C